MHKCTGLERHMSKLVKYNNKANKAYFSFFWGGGGRWMKPNILTDQEKKWSNINYYLDILCHIYIQKSTPRLLRHTNELKKVHELVYEFLIGIVNFAYISKHVIQVFA